MSVNYMYQLELLGWEGLDSPEGTTAYSKHHSCLNMPFDQDLRRQFETLTDRLRDEVTRQLAIATGELTASVEAERAAAASQAVAGASAAAEQAVAARLTDAV